MLPNTEKTYAQMKIVVQLATGRLPGAFGEDTYRKIEEKRQQLRKENLSLKSEIKRLMVSEKNIAMVESEAFESQSKKQKLNGSNSNERGSESLDYRNEVSPDKEDSSTNLIGRTMAI